MSLLHQLSSQQGDRTEAANRRIVLACLENPALLAEIERGLRDHAQAALAGDCAEVMTKVAEKQPELVAPYGSELAQLLSHTTTRVRWEAMHALSLIAAVTPETIAAHLPHIHELALRDHSTIVRLYAATAIGEYATTSRAAAQRAFPLLYAILEQGYEKQTAHALRGLRNVALAEPELAPEIQKVAIRYHNHPKPSIRKAATDILQP